MPSTSVVAPAKSIVVLISGRGSNLRAIAEAAEAWPARIAAVISNRADAEGLQWARDRGLHAVSLPSRDFTDRESFDAALQKEIDKYRPGLVLLAGFLRILTTKFVEHYAGRMLNIHPSLLPSFPGLHTHRAALDAGVRFHGATVHFVTPDLDHGPIVSQAVVPVLADDTEQSLADRVLEQEHRIYPEAVRWFLQDRLLIQGNRVVVRDHPIHLEYARNS